jgi:hypothetical protein
MESDSKSCNGISPTNYAIQKANPRDLLALSKEYQNFGTHNLCDRKEYTFNVLLEYSIIFLLYHKISKTHFKFEGIKTLNR